MNKEAIIESLEGEKINKEAIINQLKNTVGYHESDNKKEFLKGAGMAIDKCNQLHELVKDNLRKKIVRQSEELEEISQLFKTFKSLIRRHSKK